MVKKNADSAGDCRPVHPISVCSGGRDGIRTHEPLAKLTVFKTASFNRSDTLPWFNGIIVSYLPILVNERALPRETLFL